jgi:hypothetical protein
MKILQVPTTQIGLGFKPYQNQAGRYVQKWDTRPTLGMNPLFLLAWLLWKLSKVERQKI